MSIISWILPLFASSSHLLHSSSQIFSFNTATLASFLRLFMFDLYLSLSSLGIAALYSALVYPRVSKSLTSFCTSFLTGYSSLHLVLTKKVVLLNQNSVANCVPLASSSSYLCLKLSYFHRFLTWDYVTSFPHRCDLVQHIHQTSDFKSFFSSMSGSSSYEHLYLVVCSF